ncbi:hypothetical protein Bca4012_030417 [Brassica carinata]
MEGRSGGRLKAWQQPLEKEELAAETLRRSRERLERMGLFKNALLKQRTNRASGSRLAKLQDNQNKSLIQRRLSELEGYIPYLFS